MRLSDAVRGRTFPDVSRLDWLRALLSEVQDWQREGRLDGIEDPDAFWTALSETEGLARDLGHLDSTTGSEGGRS